MPAARPGVRPPTRPKRVLAWGMRRSSRGSIRCCCIALLLACSKERLEGNAADAGLPLLSEEEWRAATAPRPGPHEIWTAACNGSRVGQEYVLNPSVVCHLQYD